MRVALSANEADNARVPRAASNRNERVRLNRAVPRPSAVGPRLREKAQLLKLAFRSPQDQQRSVTDLNVGRCFAQCIE